MKITKIDRATCRMIAESAEKMMKAFGDANGLDVAFRGGTFDSGTYTAKVEFKVRENAEGLSIDEAEFKRDAVLYGLKPENFGATFMLSGVAYTICGLKSSRRTGKPVLAKSAKTGGIYKFRSDDVKRLLVGA